MRLPDGFREPRVCLPGILAVAGPAFPGADGGERRRDVAQLCRDLGPIEELAGFPLILLVDDSDFAARHVNNWIWATFTRSNPAADVHGVGGVHPSKNTGAAAGRW